MKFYTGVGSRDTPPDILELMQKIANKMYNKNIYLRTGDAFGADKAFVVGSNYLNFIYTASQATEASMDLAKKYHPVWNKLSSYVKKLHGRNSFQILGDNLDNPSICLICWTPDGCKSHRYRSIETGGTGTAISIASEYNVKVFNLKNKPTKFLFENWIKE